MPSGVSHGSAPPVGAAGAVFSNATFAKFGMRLILPHHSIGDPRRPPSLIMVRVLVADDAAKLVRAVIPQRRLARHVGAPHHPAAPGPGGEVLGPPPPGGAGD